MPKTNQKVFEDDGQDLDAMFNWIKKCTKLGYVCTIKPTEKDESRQWVISSWKQKFILTSTD